MKYSLRIIFGCLLLLLIIPKIASGMEIFIAEPSPPGSSSCLPSNPSPNYGTLCIKLSSGFQSWGWIVYNSEPSSQTGYCASACSSGCLSDWYGGGCYAGVDAGLNLRTYDYNVDPNYSGKHCKVFDSNGNVYTDGKWDDNDSSTGTTKHGCIVCHATEPKQIAIDFAGEKYSGATYETCEQVCGAAPECDEVSYGLNVPPAYGSGVCNNCVFGPAVPQCSDGKDNDGDGKIDFPADPGCTDANDNDETDVANCPTGPTYTCPAEMKCPTCPEELIGGLVPCGRMCDDPCTAECECAPCTLCHLFVLFKRIVDFATINVLFPLAVLMIVIGGIMFLTAAGDPGRIGTAKKILTSVVIGLLIIFLAWLIVDTIIMFITKSGSPFQNWSTIDCSVP